MNNKTPKLNENEKTKLWKQQKDSLQKFLDCQPQGQLLLVGGELEMRAFNRLFPTEKIKFENGHFIKSNPQQRRFFHGD